MPLDGSLTLSDVRSPTLALLCEASGRRGRYNVERLLSPRDRSLVTITSLISLYRVNELPFHLKRALENGVTRDEVIGAITHLAFYAGWPPAMTALQIARKVFEGAAP
jgi:alkylhydroperoxidase/carboxymuconolactone decarboxylase family protein YurZ